MNYIGKLVTPIHSKVIAVEESNYDKIAYLRKGSIYFVVNEYREYDMDWIVVLRYKNMKLYVTDKDNFKILQ